MISNRDISDLADRVRAGGLLLDVYDVKVLTPGGDKFELKAPVQIMTEEGHLCCQIRIFDSTVIPDPLRPLLLGEERAATIMGVEACYHIMGSTDAGVAIEMAHVWPRSVETNYNGTSTTHRFNFNRLRLPAWGSDGQIYSEMEEDLRLLNPEQSRPPAELAPSGREIEEFATVIPNVELQLTPNVVEFKKTHPYRGTSDGWRSCCYVGELLGGTFCLEAKDGDLWVFYRREVPESDSTSIPARQVFSGILDATAFLHACQPWPYFLEHRRDGRVIERWVDASKDCNRAALPPMRRGRLAHCPEAQTLFCCSAEFFAAETDEAKIFTRSLWLMREACCDGMPLEIRLLTLCSILEGLIHHFEGLLLAAEERKMVRREKWQIITSRLGLPWEGTFDRTFEQWDFFRHPLSHGFQERTDATGEVTFKAYSRITAAIYLLMVSRMGFNGPIDSSVIEDGRTVTIGKCGP